MIDEQGIQTNTSSKFNYANSILQRVDYLQFKATEYFRKGDLESWFYEWKNIKYQIVGRMKPDELKALEKIETKISYIIRNKSKGETKTMLLTKLIESYLTYIQQKIEEWEMGLVNKTDETIFT